MPKYTLEELKQRPSYKEGNPSYILSSILYSKEELSKEQLQTLSGLDDSIFQKSLDTMIKDDRLIIKEAGKSYALTDEFKRWLDRYL